MCKGKQFILAGAVAALMSGISFAEDPNTMTPGNTGSNQNQSSVGGDGEQVVGNRDDSMTRNVTRGDVDAKVDAIMDSIRQSPDRAGEKLFILENAMGNQWEIELSRLAQTKSNDAEIKELAKMVETDHGAAQAKLMSLAQQMDLDLPTSLPASKQKKLDVIGSLPEEQFNTCYLLMLKADHAKDITSFADHQAVLKDASVKAYIAEVLPKLRQHGAHVSEVASSKNIGSGDFAFGESGRDAVGNTDQSTNRDLTRPAPSPDTNRKPTDTQPPR